MMLREIKYYLFVFSFMCVSGGNVWAYVVDGVRLKLMSANTTHLYAQ